MEYTRKESAAILSAFRALEYWASCRDHTSGPVLADALRYERKARDGIRIAHALIAREARNGARSAEVRSIASLYGTARGLIFATVLGAQLGEDAVDLADENVGRAASDFLSLADAAVDAHDAAMDRAWKAAREAVTA